MAAAGTLTIVCPTCKALNRAPADKLSENTRPACGKCHAPLFKGEPTDIQSADEFERFLTQGSLPLLVDFWADWCEPCKMMAPMFHRAAQGLEPHVRLLKIDTEAHPGIAAQYAIRGIPTLILFAHSREIARQSGAMDAATIERWAKTALAAG